MEDPEEVETDLKLPHILSKEVIRNGEPSPSPNKKRKKKFAAPFETYYYRSLLWKMNWSNKMNVEVPHEYEHRLKVYIGKGNNSGLVKGLVNRRLWFATTDRIEEANFVWTQLKSLPFFKLQSKYEGPDRQTETPKTEEELKEYYSSKFGYLSRAD